MLRLSRRRSREQSEPIPEEISIPPIDRLAAAISADVGVSLEALSELGLLEDEDQTSEVLTQQYVELRSLSFQGELFPQITLSPKKVSFEGLIEALDERRHPFDDPSQVAQVWQDDYTYEELNALGVGEPETGASIHGRLAIADLSNLATDEPLLHFRGHPFDEKASRRLVLSDPREPSREIHVTVPTKQEMLARSQRNIREIFTGYNLAGLNLPAACVIMLQRRIKGEALPFQGDNHLQIAQLRRVSHPNLGRIFEQVPSLRVENGQVGIGLFGDETAIPAQAGIGLSLGRDLSE